MTVEVMDLIIEEEEMTVEVREMIIERQEITVEAMEMIIEWRATIALMLQVSSYRFVQILTPSGIIN